MSRMLAGKWLLCCTVLASLAGCANRQGWGFASGQGTIERQKARAVVHDPYPLNDIGPEVVGGRPREFVNPQAEAVRENQFPGNFNFPR